MIGFFRVMGFDGSDKAEASTKILVQSEMDSGIEGVLYLPPYLRPNQCNIKNGESVIGIMDDVTGLGVALCGFGASDYQYFLNADFNIHKSLIVKDDIKSTNGDVIATTISLQNHTHPAILDVSTTGSATAQTGSATGDTGKAQ